MPHSGGLKRKPIRLIHLSDLHFGAEDASAFDVVSRFIAGAKPEALLISGDITQRGRRREFKAARDWLDQVNVPTLVVPGNHDTPIFDMHTRIIAPFDRYRRFMDGHDVVDKLVVLDDGAIRISGINTARGVQARRNWADGVVDMDDLNAALELLSGGPQDAWRLLLCHHPLIHPQHAQIAVQTLRGEEALARCAEARVDAILTGHIHDAFADPIRTQNRPMVQMGAGTLSTRLRATRASFCVLEIDDQHMVQDVVTIDRAGLEMRRNYDSAPAADLGTRAASAR
jgi:3',5'-cyclic AMP phosphodiesterase CpdA